MNYDNVVCDGCGQVMHEDDDIVVCPVCGTPQHRECYNKNNCCVNEAGHADNFEWKAPKKPHEIELDNMKASGDITADTDTKAEGKPPVVIINPANPIDFESAFLRGVQENPETDFNGVKVREAAVYLQSGAGRYIGKFKKHEKKKHFVSWNWAAFFFSPYWFFYRKMYKAGMFFLAFSVAVSIAMAYPMNKIMPDVDTLYTMLNEYRESSASAGSEEQKALYDDYVAKTKPLIKKTYPTIIIDILAAFLIPNTVAALIANSIYKRKMLTDINISHKGSQDRKLVTLSIIRKGGISLVAAMASILVGELLPSIIVSIIEKITL